MALLFFYVKGSKQKVTKLSPFFKKMAEKHEDVPIHLKLRKILGKKMSEEDYGKMRNLILL